MSRENHIEEALDYLSRDARALAMDSIHCELHNTWATLESNRPEEDAEWFARCLWDRRRRDYLDPIWENLTPESRQHWLHIAQAAIDLLPLFCGRVAHRYDAARKAMEVIARAERVALRKAKEGHE